MCFDELIDIIIYLLYQINYCLKKQKKELLYTEIILPNKILFKKKQKKEFIVFLSNTIIMLKCQIPLS